MRCDTSNRLLRNSSRDLLGGFRVASRVMSHELSSLTRIHVVSTASDPKIPPEKSKGLKNKTEADYTNKPLHDAHLYSHSSFIFKTFRFFWGNFGSECGTPYPHPPPSGPHFFLNFGGFLGFRLLNQRIFGGVLGGVFFP